MLIVYHQSALSIVSIGPITIDFMGNIIINLIISFLLLDIIQRDKLIYYNL